MPNDGAKPIPSPPFGGRWRWIATAPWENLILWGLFFLVLCLLRNLLLVIFLTFMLCFVVRSIVNLVARRFWPEGDRPWLERLLIVGLFFLLFIGVWAAARVIGPFAVVECRQLAERVSKVDPNYEFQQVLNRTVGVYAFRRQYGSPASPEYQTAYREFVAQGRAAGVACDEFPTVEAAVARMIETKLEADRRARLSAESARRHTPREEREQNAQVLDLQLDEIKQSADYQQQAREGYGERRRSNPRVFPYSYDTYVKLKAAYPRGRAAFVAVFAQSQPADQSPGEAELQQAFEMEKRRELAADWWAKNEVALLIRHHTESELDSIAGKLEERASRFVSGLLSLPSQIITVLLLSFFITIDYPGLRAGLLRLKDSRLRFLFDDLFPGIGRIGNLIGKSFVAQGIVSSINAGLTFIALWILGIENTLLLSVVVFIFSFVPVLGIILSSIPIALMAVVQPDGSIWLALWAIGAILVIHLIEATILSPKIVGRMLHLHPVLGIVVLAIGEHFFGIWGLLLAYPVTVYLISRALNEEGAACADQETQACTE
jgi:predicted PurR-regulated permease PerM